MDFIPSELDCAVVAYQKGEMEFESLFNLASDLICDCCHYIERKLKCPDITYQFEDIKSIVYMAFYQSTGWYDVRKGYHFSTLFYKCSYSDTLTHTKKFLKLKRKPSSEVMSLDYEYQEFDHSPFSQIVGCDGFEIYRREELLNILDSIMVEHNFEPGIREAIMAHLTTGNPLCKEVAKRGFLQPKASKKFTELKKIARKKMGA